MVGRNGLGLGRHGEVGLVSVVGRSDGIEIGIVKAREQHAGDSVIGGNRGGS